ncbi:MAG: electron transfer flavoprotein subunit beta/FixA family protein [Acidimicrobiia bacterium]
MKRVPAPGARIAITEDAQDVDTNMLGFAISPHEECAVEEAIRLVEKHGGSTTVITLGPPEAEDQLRAAFAIGADAAALLATDVADWAPMPTAAALAAAVEDLEGREGVFDLILVGNESADAGGYQVGVRMAYALDRPILSGIKSIDIADDRLTGTRETPTGNEVYEVGLPAVVAVKEGINLPRYPTLKGRLGAKKKEVETFSPEHASDGQTKVRLLEPPEQQSETRILGDGPGAAPAVVDVLEELGLL